MTARDHLHEKGRGRNLKTIAHLGDMTEYSQPNRHVFFGYYDVVPFAAQGKRLLSHSVNFNFRSPRPGDQIEVGFFETDGTQVEYQRVADTTAWCWQMGSRLRWLDQEGTRLSLSHRSAGRSRARTVFLEVDGGDEVAEFPPLFDLNLSTQFGVSLDFIRLQKMRPGYGYAERIEDSSTMEHDRIDGLSFIDLESGETLRQLSLDEIISVEEQVQSLPIRPESHYVNHASFSPDGTSLVFLHIASVAGRRFSRMLHYRFHTGDLAVVLPGPIVSHFCWVGDSRLVVFADRGFGKEWVVVDVDGHDVLPVGFLRSMPDGHPSMVEGGLILCDTYPRRWRDQLLYLSDADGTRELLTSYRPRVFTGEWRCDFHPRYDASSGQICFDDVAKGWRVMRSFDLGALHFARP